MPFDAIVPAVFETRLVAADLIEAGIRRITHKRDWCRNELFHTHRGWFTSRMQYCAMGAVTIVARPEILGPTFATVVYQRDDLRLALFAMNQAAERRGFKSIADLNNDPQCKHAHVLSAMREAVKCLRDPKAVVPVD